MKVAVCDDLKEVLKDTKILLENISFVKDIDVFSDMKNFYEEIKEGTKYDVVLMDIDWKTEKTGIDFSSELKQLSPNTKIIYITAYTLDYVEDAVLRTPNLCGFINKPIKEEILYKSLEKIQRELKETDGKLIIKYKSNVSVIPFGDIYYLESQLHKVAVKLQNQEYQCTEKLTDIKKRLDIQFLECHKSYIVNMNHIAEIHNTEILMENGEVIPISKKRYGETKARFFEYMAERI